GRSRPQRPKEAGVLVELGLVEQRYKAVSEVIIDGATVTEVAARYGVVRQTLHEWLLRYANHGLAGLADRSSRPGTCPHQIDPVIEAAIVVMRKEHPGWGPRTILNQLRRREIDPLPGRSSIHRALVRNGLIDPQARRRKRADYKRGERTRSMELWQMDVMGRVFLTSGVELKVITGVDDHSRFCVVAKLVFRATARPVCAALAEAMRAHGVPDDILTDNGKVFTDRFGKARSEVLFEPDLSGERRAPHPHRPSLAHHHRQDRALPQDPSGRVLQPACLRDHRRGPGRPRCLGRALQL
ncbi:MAG TPA: helix-turn-helix domain-containing protein, partial [Acidimicrobiales bacterium]|nr:helix-turn-helix domain-containing protein [Acidimicrobiales bacterium]